MKLRMPVFRELSGLAVAALCTALLAGCATMSVSSYADRRDFEISYRETFALRSSATNTF